MPSPPIEWVINREERHAQILGYLILQGKILWFIVEVFVGKVVGTQPEFLLTCRQ